MGALEHVVMHIAPAVFANLHVLPHLLHAGTEPCWNAAVGPVPPAAGTEPRVSFHVPLHIMIHIETEIRVPALGGVNPREHPHTKKVARS